MFLGSVSCLGSVSPVCKFCTWFLLFLIVLIGSRVQQFLKSSELTKRRHLSPLSKTIITFHQ
jgi:hypothetical protein